MDVNTFPSTSPCSNASRILSRSSSTDESAAQVVQQFKSAGNSPVNGAARVLACGENLRPSADAKSIAKCLCYCHGYPPAASVTPPHVDVPLIFVNPSHGGEPLIPVTPTDVPPININHQLPGGVTDEPELSLVNEKPVLPGIELENGEHGTQGNAVITKGKSAEILTDEAQIADEKARADEPVSANAVNGEKGENGLPGVDVLPDEVDALTLAE